jgi:hypothetical protein
VVCGRGEEGEVWPVRGEISKFSLVQQHCIRNYVNSKIKFLLEAVSNLYVSTASEKGCLYSCKRLPSSQPYYCGFSRVTCAPRHL